MRGLLAGRRRSGGFSALSVIGGLYPPEFLNLIAEQKAKHQAGADYGLTKSLTLKDEIARYWRIANDLYAERALLGDKWCPALLRDVFGYTDILPIEPERIGERSYPITHAAFDGGVRFVLTVPEVLLDRANPRFGDGRGRAPNGLLQDALNADSTRPWGIVANGETLRLMRENPSLTRPSYFQADLARIFDEQLYADFAGLWLTIHASRLAPVSGRAASCILEAWRAEAQETGERALEHLREGVAIALGLLGNGFLRQEANEHLRRQVHRGELSAQDIFQQLLRLVYRLLFLFTVEDRNLLHEPGANDEQLGIYRDGYSTARLRERALRRRHYDRHSDLWQGIQILFDSLRTGAEAVGIPALGGLFSNEQCRDLDSAIITNDDLLEAIRALAYFRSGGALARVNYRDMGTEEFGSVYESLLELHPYIKVDTSPWTFGLIGQEGEKTKGAARKLTGSYYTPTPLVNELIRSALDPVINSTIVAPGGNPRTALLDLRVIDPACGSGHFLLAAARRIASEIARIEGSADTPDESARQHALREVVQHCIYGVDRNPLAVELCRTALWIEAVEPGKPLTFLDPHVRLGDSLLGILNPSIMADGVPDAAYEAVTGDDKAVCRNLKKRNRDSSSGVQGSLFDQGSLKEVAGAEAVFESLPEETLEQIEDKRKAWERAQQHTRLRREELRADLFAGAFFATKKPETQDRVPLSEDINRLQRNMAMRGDAVEYASALSLQHRFFHWHVAFAEIMQRGGFDVVLGNPPWGVYQLNEEDYFDSRDPQIAKLDGDERKRAIAALCISNPPLWEAFSEELRRVQCGNQFFRGSGRFTLASSGKINSDALFAETVLALLSPHGRVGVVLPTDILSGYDQRQYFHYIIDHSRLKSSIGFENEEFIFPGIANVNRFALITLGPSSGDQTNAEFKLSFYLRRVEQMAEERRVVPLTSDDFRLLNPNTRTSPVFRTRVDADLTRRIYSRTPILIKDGAASGNPWGIHTRQGLFNSTTHSRLFRKAAQLIACDAIREGPNWVDPQGIRYVPLYEGKFIWFYDHRFSSYHNVGKIKGRGGRGLPPVTLSEHEDPNFTIEPRYWVQEADVETRLSNDNWRHRWLLGWRDVASAKLERTFVTTVIPRLAVADKILLYFPECEPNLMAALLANLSSIVFDYFVRQKMAGTSFKEHYFKQLPALPPSAYVERDFAFIVPRVVELCFTSFDVRGFASDLCYDGPPFEWNDQRRALLMAELDAYFARRYGLSREELCYVLDPTDVYGSDFPSETFRVLKEREVHEHGEYRTARLVLAAWDKMEEEFGGLSTWAD